VTLLPHCVRNSNEIQFHLRPQLSPQPTLVLFLRVRKEKDTNALLFKLKHLMGIKQVVGWVEKGKVDRKLGDKTIQG
jgi:hypothetical protein